MALIRRLSSAAGPRYRGSGNPAADWRPYVRTQQAVRQPVEGADPHAALLVPISCPIR